MQHSSLLRLVAPDVVTVASRVGVTASATLSSRLKNVENNNNNFDGNKTSKTHESESESVHLYPFSSNHIATNNNNSNSNNFSSNSSRANTSQSTWPNNSKVENNNNNVAQKFTLSMTNNESASSPRGTDPIANENNNNSNSRNFVSKTIKNIDNLFQNNINNNGGGSNFNNSISSSSSSTKNTSLTNISLGATKTPGKSNTGFPDIPHPYATEGGQVPIYQMQYGIIYKRNWIYRNPEWCELCREPCIQWVQHIGRKDHCLMDMYYTAHVEWKRRWNPEELLKHFYKELKLPLPSYQNVYTNYEREHHNELYAMLVELSEAGMLNFDSPSETFLHRMQGGLRGMSAQGALVLHELILLPFMRLFPHAHIQDLSNLLDFVTCSYNLETVYDLCGLYTLDKVARREQYAATSPAALGLGGIATSSSPTTGFARDATASLAQQQQQQQRNGGYNSINENNLMNKNSGVGVSDPQVEMNRPISKAEIMRNRLKAKQQEDLDSEVLSHKGTFVRSILGQLRWLILPNQIHPAKFTFPEHVIMLGEICLKTFVAEIAATRLCEYVTRCEVPWRNAGFERKRLSMREIIKDKSDVTPPYVRFSYKPMSPKFDDVYTIEPSLLDKEVREKLKRKGLPVLPEYEEEDEKINTSTNRGGGSSNNYSVDGKAKKLRQTELPKVAGQPRLYSVNT